MDWYARSVPAMAACGVDVIHMSDDWGRNHAMMFSPQTWWDLVFPADKLVVDAVHAIGLPCSLHSCGYFTDVLDGCVALGLDVINPIQTSAGMDPWQVKRDFGDKLCVYGGLDIRHVLRAATEEDLHDEVRRLAEGLKPGGGFIFCTAHAVQPDTDLDRVVRVYEWAREYGRYGG
jgi:uroporphyrinogen decarboxylase